MPYFCTLNQSWSCDWFEDYFLESWFHLRFLLCLVSDTEVSLAVHLVGLQLKYSGLGDSVMMPLGLDTLRTRYYCITWWK